jgi:hypothetical protein
MITIYVSEYIRVYDSEYVREIKEALDPQSLRDSYSGGPGPFNTILYKMKPLNHNIKYLSI